MRLKKAERAAKSKKNRPEPGQSPIDGLGRSKKSKKSKRTKGSKKSRKSKTSRRSKGIKKSRKSKKSKKSKGSKKLRKSKKSKRSKGSKASRKSKKSKEFKISGEPRISESSKKLEKFEESNKATDSKDPKNPEETKKSEDLNRIEGSKKSKDYKKSKKSKDHKKSKKSKDHKKSKKSKDHKKSKRSKKSKKRRSKNLKNSPVAVSPQKPAGEPLRNSSGATSRKSLKPSSGPSPGDASEKSSERIVSKAVTGREEGPNDEADKKAMQKSPEGERAKIELSNGPTAPAEGLGDSSSLMLSKQISEIVTERVTKMVDEELSKRISEKLNKRLNGKLGGGSSRRSPKKLKKASGRKRTLGLSVCRSRPSGKKKASKRSKRRAQEKSTTAKTPKKWGRTSKYSKKRVQPSKKASTTVTEEPQQPKEGEKSEPFQSETSAGRSMKIERKINGSPATGTKVTSAEREKKNKQVKVSKAAEEFDPRLQYHQWRSKLRGASPSLSVRSRHHIGSETCLSGSDPYLSDSSRNLSGSSYILTEGSGVVSQSSGYASDSFAVLHACTTRPKACGENCSGSFPRMHGSSQLLSGSRRGSRRGDAQRKRLDGGSDDTLQVRSPSILRPRSSERNTTSRVRIEAPETPRLNLLDLEDFHVRASVFKAKYPKDRMASSPPEYLISSLSEDQQRAGATDNGRLSRRIRGPWAASWLAILLLLNGLTWLQTMRNVNQTREAR